MTDVPALRRALLDWYDRNARPLPWRTSPADRALGVRPDPYAVWLSEIMLQQTTTVHAAPYFLTFLRRWPRVADLAAAADADVMAAWAGLGYYARARNLLACARAVAARPDGAFPDTEAGLAALPGIGPYTAAAVAAIAFDRPANVVDGNGERVMARLNAMDVPLPAAKPALKALAAGLVTDDRPGDWAQALMDLGATICRPATPLCEDCPLAFACGARAGNKAEVYPLKSEKPKRPVRHGAVYLATSKGRVGLVRRPPKGLLGGMLALPTTDWTASPLNPSEVLAAAPGSGDWTACGTIEHTFTHFHLVLQVWTAEAPAAAAEWRPVSDLSSLPSVFLKAARAALGTT